MEMATVKNWTNFQHYKDRAPPWIKLHRTILDDFDFARLPIASKALAPCIWLLASESKDGSIPIDPEWLAFRLHWQVPDVEAGLKALIAGGFLIRASTVLAPCPQDACLETEGETEGETEKACASPDGEAPTRKPIPFQQIVDGYNAAMTKIAKVRDITPKRRTAIRRAWQESPTRQTVEFWQAYWEECAEDPFRNGTGPYKPPHESWRPTFDFLIRSEQITAVYEKAMQRLEAA